MEENVNIMFIPWSFMKSFGYNMASLTPKGTLGFTMWTLLRARLGERAFCFRIINELNDLTYPCRDDSLGILQYIIAIYSVIVTLFLNVRGKGGIYILKLRHFDKVEGVGLEILRVSIRIYSSRLIRKDGHTGCTGWKAAMLPVRTEEVKQHVFF